MGDKSGVVRCLAMVNLLGMLSGFRNRTVIVQLLLQSNATCITKPSCFLEVSTSGVLKSTCHSTTGCFIAVTIWGFELVTEILGVQIQTMVTTSLPSTCANGCLNIGKSHGGF